MSYFALGAILVRAGEGNRAEESEEEAGGIWTVDVEDMSQ
jgi:hypothetical protein